MSKKNPKVIECENVLFVRFPTKETQIEFEKRVQQTYDEMYPLNSYDTMDPPPEGDDCA